MIIQRRYNVETLQDFKTRILAQEAMHLEQETATQVTSTLDMYEHVEGRKCRILDYNRLPSDNFTCVTLKVETAPFICVYDRPEKDVYVSAAILKGELFEAGNVRLLESELKKDPELGFIDIGSNVGQFSVVAAAMGRKVLSVEALQAHVRMLARAAVRNGFQDRMKIVHNAASDSYRTVSLVTPPGNMGMTRIKTNQGQGYVAVAEGVPTILLDDLASVVHFRRAIMKLDIEGEEVPALSHSSKLFDAVDIPLVFMEWWGGEKPYELYRSPEQVAMVNTVLEFLTARGYRVYDTAKRPSSLDQWKKWPFEVLWIKDTQKI